MVGLERRRLLKYRAYFSGSPGQATMQTRDDLSYAGFWIRLWASIIDTVLVVMVAYPLLRLFYGAPVGDADVLFHDPLTQIPDIDALFRGPADFLIQVVFPAVAVVTFWVFRSATPGKMAIGAQILDARTGDKPSTAQLIGRYFAYYVSAIPFGFGFLWVAFDARKQGWHDKLAGTVVVRPKATVRFDAAPGSAA